MSWQSDFETLVNKPTNQVVPQDTYLCRVARIAEGEDANGLEVSKLVLRICKGTHKGNVVFKDVKRPIANSERAIDTLESALDCLVWADVRVHTSKAGRKTNIVDRIRIVPESPDDDEE
jgi:hypothetical protein